MNRASTFLLGVSAGAALLAGALRQQGEPAKPASGPSAIEAATPGPAHKRLAQRAGSYATSTKFVGTGAPPDSKGSATIKPVLEGRFLLEENAGSFEGQPSAGMRVLGYNNATKQYEGFWMFTGSTAVMSLAGTSADDGKTIELAGAFEAAPGVKQAFRIVSREIDADHFVVEMHAKLADGSEGASFETTYTRR